MNPATSPTPPPPIQNHQSPIQNSPAPRSPLRPAVVELRTPEGILFTLEPAGPMARLLALLIDYAAVSVILQTLNIVLLMAKIIHADFARGLAIWLQFAAPIAYSLACEWFWRGQTFGKRLFRLRVLDARGLRLQFTQVVIRNLLRPLDLLPLFYLTGGLTAWLSPKGQRLGDFAAGTMVIREPVLFQPDLDQVSPGRFNSLRAHPHLAARLRQQVSPELAATALQALLRREGLDPAARVRLFAELAAVFRAKVALPEADLAGLPDEQLVRNVVDVLYRPRPDRDAPA